MPDFTADEREALRRCQLAVFEDRIIQEARPPIDDIALASIARRCAGPIPDGLLSLWRVAFGGRLSYGLRVAFEGHEAPASFAELFWPGSDSYRDLWGWIDHESELAREAADQEGRRWSGKLEYLPFGGFEYLERVYVKVAPGPDHGAVFIWMKGLPPAWRLRLHEDSIARVADDVPALFRELAFDIDPAEDEDSAGRELLERLDQLAALGAAGESARARLAALVRGAVLDWRAAVADGTVTGSPRLRRLAIEAAARADDVELIGELMRLGCALDERLGGGGTAIDHALAQDSMSVARILLDQNVSVVDGIRNAAPHASPELVRELLARGAEPDALAALAAVQGGNLDSGLAIARALLQEEPELAGSLREQALDRAEREEAAAARIESGKMGSNQTPAECRADAERLRQFAARLRT